MQDVSCIKALAESLERSVKEQDIETILSLCENNDTFIRSLQPTDDKQINAALAHLVEIHRLAIDLVQDAHGKMKQELFQSTQNRKNVSTYEGVKNAE